MDTKMSKVFEYDGAKEKTCCACNQTKPTSDFHKDKTRLYGVASTCKDCTRIRTKNHYEANKEKIHKRGRYRHLRDSYGITPEIYQDMLNEQNGVCAICGRPEQRKLNNKIKKLPIDHCHTTRQVRGLLCSECNTALGLFDDDIDVLASAISYLQNTGYRKTGS